MLPPAYRSTVPPGNSPCNPPSVRSPHPGRPCRSVERDGRHGQDRRRCWRRVGQGDPEQRPDDARRIGPTLVRQYRDRNPLGRQLARRRPEAEQASGVAVRPMAVDVDDLRRRARTGRTVCSGPRRDIVEHRPRVWTVAGRRRRTGPAPNGRDRARSRRSPPAPPAAVTTDVNGAMVRAVAQVDRAERPSRRTRSDSRGRLGRCRGRGLIPGVVEPERTRRSGPGAGRPAMPGRPRSAMSPRT